MEKKRRVITKNVVSVFIFESLLLSPLRKVINIVIFWAKALIITHMSIPGLKARVIKNQLFIEINRNTLVIGVDSLLIFEIIFCCSTSEIISLVNDSRK
jgi:hypothetical protein